MTADFGKDNLEYTRKKGEEDLDALRASYKILKDLEDSGKYRKVNLSHGQIQ